MKQKHWLVLSLFSLLVFLDLLFTVANRNPQIDLLINSWAVSLQNTTTDGFFIFLGKYSVAMMIAIASLTIIHLAISKRENLSMIMLLSLPVGYIFETGIKFFVGRVRPVPQMIPETSFSFPSGHSIFSMILFSTLIYFYKDKIKNKTAKYSFIVINIFLILLVGFSRIYLNMHWFTDVVGGYALGLFLVSLEVWFLKKLKNRTKSF